MLHSCEVSYLNLTTKILLSSYVGSLAAAVTAQWAPHAPPGSGLLLSLGLEAKLVFSLGLDLDLGERRHDACGVGLVREDSGRLSVELNLALPLLLQKLLKRLAISCRR